MTAIAVHLTELAPGCGSLSLNDRRRWKTFYAKPIANVLRATLRRIERAPDEVTVGLYGDEPALLVTVPGEAGAWPVARFWDGAALNDLAEALAGLKATGWRPDPITPSKHKAA